MQQPEEPGVQPGCSATGPQSIAEAQREVPEAWQDSPEPEPEARTAVPRQQEALRAAGTVRSPAEEPEVQPEQHPAEPDIQAIQRSVRLHCRLSACSGADRCTTRFRRAL